MNILLVLVIELIKNRKIQLDIHLEKYYKTIAHKKNLFTKRISIILNIIKLASTKGFNRSSTVTYRFEQRYIASALCYAAIFA